MIDGAKPQVNSIQIDFIEAARMLAKLQEEDLAAFRSLAKSLGIRLRKAYYLAQVGKSIEGLPVSKDRLTLVGWTKLQLLSPYITASNSKVSACWRKRTRFTS